MIHCFSKEASVRAKQFCVLTTTESSAKIGGGSVVVDLLFNVLPIVCGRSVFVFVLLYITLCRF